MSWSEGSRPAVGDQDVGAGLLGDAQPARRKGGREASTNSSRTQRAESGEVARPALAPRLLTSEPDLT